MMEVLFMPLGQRIKSLRKKHKFTQLELASKANISRTYLADVENNRYNPSYATLEGLASALNVSTDRLTGEAAISIIEDRIEELSISLVELAEKASVPLHFLQNLDSVTPDESDYILISRVAEALELPPGTLRAAFARQEPPAYDGPTTSAAEDFAEPYQESEPELPDLIEMYIEKQKKPSLKEKAPVKQESNTQTIAAHRTDDPTKELPEAARKSIEDFKRYIYEKHGIKYD
jgi:transcriptional regulator with XRE-family HTH domain